MSGIVLSSRGTGELVAVSMQLLPKVPKVPKRGTPLFGKKNHFTIQNPNFAQAAVMAQRYDRILFRAGGQAVIWQSVDRGKLIQGVEKVKVLKMADVREEELEEDNCHFLVTFTLEYRGATDEERSNQFRQEFSLDDVRKKLLRSQFKKNLELPKITRADQTVYDTLVRMYQDNDLPQFKKKIRTLRNLLTYGTHRHAVYLI